MQRIAIAIHVYLNYAAYNRLVNALIKAQSTRISVEILNFKLIWLFLWAKNQLYLTIKIPCLQTLLLVRGIYEYIYIYISSLYIPTLNSKFLQSITISCCLTIFIYRLIICSISVLNGKIPHCVYAMQSDAAKSVAYICGQKQFPWLCKSLQLLQLCGWVCGCTCVCVCVSECLLVCVCVCEECEIIA